MAEAVLEPIAPRAQLERPAHGHGRVVREDEPGGSAARVPVLQHEVGERVPPAEDRRRRARVAALPERRPRPRLKPRPGMDEEVHRAALRAEVEVLREGERARQEVERLAGRGLGRPGEQRVREFPDGIRVRHVVGAVLEVEHVLPAHIGRKRRTPPVVHALDARLPPERAARVERERVASRARTEEDGAGVLDKTLRRRAHRHVVLLEADDAVLAVRAVGRQLAARPVGGVAVDAVRHGGQPGHALVRTDRIRRPRRQNRSQGQKPERPCPSRRVHVSPRRSLFQIAHAQSTSL